MNFIFTEIRVLVFKLVWSDFTLFARVLFTGCYVYACNFGIPMTPRRFMLKTSNGHRQSYPEFV